MVYIIEPKMSLDGKYIPLPLTPQEKEYTCGASIVRSIIEYNEDIEHSEAEIVKAIKANSKFGAKQQDIVKYFKKAGYPVFHKQHLNIGDVFEILDQKQPIITCIQAWANKKVDYTTEDDSGHYIILVGYSTDLNIVVIADPAISNAYGYLPIKDFIERWHGDFEDTMNNYGMVVIGKLDGKPIRIDKKELKKIK
jgi:predicted double-glycine peptidase